MGNSNLEDPGGRRTITTPTIGETTESSSPTPVTSYRTATIRTPMQEEVTTISQEEGPTRTITATTSTNRVIAATKTTWMRGEALEPQMEDRQLNDPKVSPRRLLVTRSSSWQTSKTVSAASVGSLHSPT